MFKIEEKYGSIYCKDADSGNILYEIEEPTVYFSWNSELEDICVHRLGDKKFVKKKYDEDVRKYIDAGLSDVIEDMYLCDLPKDVEILQRVYDNNRSLMILFKELLVR